MQHQSCPKKCKDLKWSTIMMVVLAAAKCYTLTDWVCTYGWVCVVFTWHLWRGYAQIYAFPCVHVCTDSSLASLKIRNTPRCACVCVPYLVKMWNSRLPPVKLELLVNVVLQALTHAALLVCWIGFQAEQAVTLLETERQKEKEREREARGVEKRTAGN